MNTSNTSPLVREPHQQKISFALSVLQVAVKNNGLIGLVGTNTVAEPFFRDFLNIVYDLNLDNLNDGIANYPAIDLGDTAARLCFQVSSTGTKAKVQKTLTVFGDPKHKLTSAYDKLRIFVIGKRVKKYEKLNIPKGVKFDQATDVVDVPLLIKSLPNVPTTKLIALSQLIDQEMPMFAAATSVEHHTDDQVLKEYRSHFYRRALLDPWQQEGNVADFRDAIDSLLGLLTTGCVEGEPKTKPIRRISDKSLKRRVERVHEKLMLVRRLFTHHERLGDIDPVANFGNFNNPAISSAFDSYRQDVVDEMNAVLTSASLQPLPGLAKFP